MNPNFGQQVLALLPFAVIAVACGLCAACVLDYGLSRVQLVLRSHYGEEYVATPICLSKAAFQVMACLFGGLFFLSFAF